MILPLRRAHFAISLLMVAALPAAWAIALRSRVAMPVAPAPAGVGPGGADLSAAWKRVEIDTRLSADGRLVLAPRVDLRRPDVLVYWRPRGERREETDLGTATLLGTLAGTQRRRFSLPEAARSRAGELVLYSLGHREIVDRASLGPLISAED